MCDSIFLLPCLFLSEWLVFVHVSMCLCWALRDSSRGHIAVRQIVYTVNTGDRRHSGKMAYNSVLFDDDMEILVIV